jgi:hypothetical protein
MSESVPLRQNEAGQPVDIVDRPIEDASAAFVHTAKHQTASVDAFNKLTDQKQERLNQVPTFTIEDQQDRSAAAAVLLDTAQESGIRAAQLRETNRKAERHMSTHEAGYRQAALDLANADLEAQGKPLVNPAGPGDIKPAVSKAA